jgi:aldose sugar dehydrogenase
LMAASLPACAQPVALTKPDRNDYSVSVFAKGLDQPWGMAVLPDGRLLVTEKKGDLRIISADGKLIQTLSGVPKVIARGQGGLLDVSIDPDFAANGFIYLSYSEGGTDNLVGTAVARAKLMANNLTELTVIWRQTPKVSGPNHWGSRLVWGKDGNLFITVGDRGNFRKLAQDLTTTIGKTIRIKPDGTIPTDNPFVGRSDAKPEIWSYGHRNMQGAFVHPDTGQLWTHEHGPQGGDELNLDQKGKNYGWPLTTYGKEYSGQYIAPETLDGTEPPLYQWTPSIAPSGMVYYTGPYAPLQGKVFIGSLRFRYLTMLSLEGTKVTKEERLLKDMNERVRDVEQALDGSLFVAFDSSDGQIVRLKPK